MRTKDKEMLQSIKHFVNDYCDANGRGPSISEVAKSCGMSKSNPERIELQGVAVKVIKDL